ncbi:hypothetical protein BIW11_07243 [Tropilaelaps mercedesae]|uniref:Uncharacterized protein n=1 Tax=Tropilaelaps mercedesae TaxID=418985 RepID=A0A1V9XUW8_9ACAR|nr:hypothetical protein BIW11_07243 [Tropilaelaps mercedesae]
MENSQYSRCSYSDSRPVRVIYVNICLTLAIASATYAQTGDKFLDDLLNNAKNMARIRTQLDPLRLDDVEMRRIVLYDITIQNLLSLERCGPAELSSSRQNITMDTTLAVHDVVIRAKFRLKREVRILRPRGSISAIIEHLLARIRVHVNLFEGTMTLVLFEVTQLGHLRIIKVTGIGAFNKIAQRLAQRIIINGNREKIRKAIEGRGREAIEQALRQADITSLI